MNVAKLRKLGRPITPSDLRNPRVESGYDYVNGTGVPPHSSGWRASIRSDDGTHTERTRKRGKWRGRVRPTPHVAAQDFCDYFNGNPALAPVTLKSAGHEYEVDERDTDPEYEAALGVIRDRTAQRRGKQGYVYLIIEETQDSSLQWGKIGYSTNPRKRVAELQTGNPRPLRLHLMKPGTEADEAALHQKYIHLNVLQEWFRLTKELLLEWGVEHQMNRRAA